MFLLAPFGILSFGLIHQGHHFTIMVVGLVLLASMIANKWLKASLLYCALWQVVMFLMVMKMNLPLEELGPSIMFMLFILVGGVIYLASLESDFENEAFYNLFCIAALIQSAISLLQYCFAFDPLLYILRFFVQAQVKLDANVVTGTLGNPNFVAAYLAISLPFFFRGILKSRKPQWWWGAIPVALVIILSGSSSAAIPAIIGVAFYFGGVKWAALGVIPGILYLMGDFASHKQLDAGVIHSRAEVWRGVADQIYNQSFVNFIFGRGNASFYGRPYPMHNEWLQCFHNYGLVGLAMITGYVATIYKGNRVLFTAFIIAVINCFGSYPLHLAPSAFLILIIMGLIERERI